MIQYLFTSALLAVIGWILYLLMVRRRASLPQRKWFIYATILTSMLLPATVSPIQPEIDFFVEESINPLAFGQGQINEMHLQQYCRCDQPNYSHRIQYRANAFYYFLFEYKGWFYLALGLAILGVLAKLLLQLTYLRSLVRSSRIESHALDGEAFKLLYPSKAIGVGAFQLGQPYIIWQAEMAELSEAEKRAIFHHELSHLKQRNTLEKALLRILQCWWFFHPVFYYFRRELELISECLADRAGATALPHPRQYAELLLRLKSQQFVSLVQHFRASVLKIRIQTLLVETPRKGKLAIVAFALLLAMQIGLVSPLAAQVSDTLFRLQTYEEIYHKVSPETQEAVYCTDCDTVCSEQ